MLVGEEEKTGGVYCRGFFSVSVWIVDIKCRDKTFICSVFCALSKTNVAIMLSKCRN